MPAANKTTNIDLNQWQANEYPKREDFNLDNTKIDAKFGDHETRITDLETNTTDQSILEAVKNVDGSTSGLDADLLDGQEGNFYKNTDNHVDGITNKVFTAAEKAKLLGIEDGATVGLIPEEILTELKTIDGSNSGLDSDLLDGKHGNYYLNVDNHVNGTSNKVYTTSEKSKLAGIEPGATKNQSASEIRDLLKTVDGSGSGIDADKLDGIEASQLLRSDVENPSGKFEVMYLDNVMYSNGDTNTYMQFHAADQWRVVTGGAERLEVNNSAVSINNALLKCGTLNTSAQDLKGAINELAGRSEGLIGTSVKILPINVDITAASNSLHTMFNITGEKVILGGHFYMTGYSNQGGVSFHLIADNQTIFNYSIKDLDFANALNNFETYYALDPDAYYGKSAWNDGVTSGGGTASFNMQRLQQMGITTNLKLTATTGSHTANQAQSSTTATVQPFSVRCKGIIYYTTK